MYSFLSSFSPYRAAKELGRGLSACQKLPLPSTLHLLVSVGQENVFRNFSNVNNSRLKYTEIFNFDIC